MRLPARTPALLPGAASILAVVFACWLGFLWFVGPGGSGRTLVSIERGASLSSAAERLEAAGVVGNAALFTATARLLGGDRPIQFGDYAFDDGAAWQDVLGKMQRGDVQRYLLTIPEGMPSILVHERLLAEPRLVGPLDVPAEGSILPETYAFVRGETRAALVGRMQRAMTAAVADEWSKRGPRAAVHTPEGAVVLASIVEKETAMPSERARVAAVYSNRLRAGMKLDADPTVIYPVTRGKPLARRILRSELAAVNGYNTYAMAGLPVGPIANPSRAAIHAVLHPAESRALYFVADGRGGHIFADSYAEHQANVARWRGIRRARGEL